MKDYTKQTENLLEFDILIEELKSGFLSEYGREFFEQTTIQKIWNQTEIEKRYTFLSEFNFLKTQFPDFPIQHVSKFSSHLGNIEIENYYIPREDILKLKLLVTNIRDIKQFFKDTIYQKELLTLADFSDTLFYDTALLREIDKIIDEEGIVKSSASKELGVLRLRKKTIYQEIDKAFSFTLSQAKQSGLLNEIGESIRQGRRVLAINSAYKRSIKGMVIDESETGSVIFIEPAATIYLNNEASEIDREEEREIRKVLIVLTRFIAKYKNLIIQYQEFMAQWDGLQAINKFKERIEGSLPRIGSSLELNNAFHPLLKLKNKKEANSIIPFHLKFDIHHQMLVISGPNAGGKTITLKSIGLIALMVQKALPISSEAGSVVPLYEAVHGDLGDLQSINDELSTYSSKLRLWNFMMKTANKKTLLLFDELGDGTDPSFGAAMAQAVLEKLLDQKSTVIATTHYGDLKKFSESRKDTLSASMLFDEVKLEPLFKLSIGFPGSSYTFHIARKMGLNHEVIKRAETLSESEKVLYDRQLFKLEKKEKELQSQKMELVRAEQDLKKQVKDWNRLHLDMDLTRKKMRYEKTILLQEQIAEKEKELKLFKEELKNKKKLEELVIEQTKLNEEKESTNLASKELYKQINKVNPNQKFAIGDRVQFIQTNAIGVIEKMNKDRVTVIFDHLKSTISASELIWLPPDEDKKKTTTKKIITIDKNGSRELDIRGQFVYEAIEDLDDFINRALLNNYHEIKIIHGKGKLRAEIIKHLQTFKSITKCNSALPEHGGEGVTYVHF